jgi:hypothetical protein
VEQEVADWAEVEELGEAEEPFVLSLAPVGFHKDNISGVPLTA